MNAYEKKTAAAEKFWKSTNAEKASLVREMIVRKEFVKLHSYVMSARVIDNVVAKSYGDMFFDKFVTLIYDLKISGRDIMPFLLNCLTSFDATSAWKECAQGYLLHVCKTEYDSILAYATENPSVILWQSLVAAYPEQTTDYMLELLLEKKGKNKTILREVLAESKLDIISLLEESYDESPLAVKAGIVRMLLMYKKDAHAVRVLEGIHSREKSLTVLRLFGGGDGMLTFKYPCSYEDGVFSICDSDDECSFKLSGDEIKVINATSGGLSLAKKAVKCRRAYLENSFYTGEQIEVYIFAEALSRDKLFAKLCENYIFAVYNNSNYPVKLFMTLDSYIRPITGEVDAESDEFMSVAHPAELADSTLQYPTDGYFWQMKRDCFLPSKDEYKLSSIAAFGAAVIDAPSALKRAAKRGLKVTVSEDYNYFNVKWGNYYCVYTFSANKNAISLGSASFYDYSKLPVSGNKIILKSAMPITIEFVPVRIFSEFLGAVYYAMRGTD